MTEPRIVEFLVSELRLPPRERELLGREWWPSYAYAVIHPDGVFLFDNGVGVGTRRSRRRSRDRSRRRSRSVGSRWPTSPALRTATCTSTTPGRTFRLPKGVPIFVQRGEWAMVHEPEYTVAEWIDVPGPTYEVLDGETEVASGLRLVATPGHTAGHQSLVVETSIGPVVLAGQALQSRAEWNGATEPSASGRSSAPDPDAYDRSVERLRTLDPVRVRFAHDPAICERGQDEPQRER